MLAELYLGNHQKPRKTWEQALCFSVPFPRVFARTLPETRWCNGNRVAADNSTWLSVILHTELSTWGRVTRRAAARVVLLGSQRHHDSVMKCWNWNPTCAGSEQDSSWGSGCCYLGLPACHPFPAIHFSLQLLNLKRWVVWVVGFLQTWYLPFMLTTLFQYIYI